MNLFDKFISFFKKDKRDVLRERYGAITYCHCGEILQENSTMESLHEDGLYRFTCNNCGAENFFHYGLAPVPISMDEDEVKEYL